MARRSILAVPVWLALAVALRFIAKFGAVAGELSVFTIMLALFSLAAGVPVGLITARGLVDSVGFTGWVPWGFAAAFATVIVLVGTLVLGLLVPISSPFHVAVLCVTAALGAVAAVTKKTWAES